MFYGIKIVKIKIWLYGLYFNILLELNNFFHYKRKRNIKVFVTGLPRSGTSFITGLIIQMGFHPGPQKWLKKGDKHNKYGYFECQPLFNICLKILNKINRGYFHNLPKKSDLNSKLLHKEINLIRKVVNYGNVEIYKENKLIVLGGFFNKIYPEAKWIFINRNIEDSFKSQFGPQVSKEEYIKIVNKQLSAWDSSQASKKAFYINYEDFYTNPENTLIQLSKYLNIELDDKSKEKCLSFFRPNIHKS